MNEKKPTNNFTIIGLLIFFLTLNSVLQIDAYLFSRQITTFPPWIVTGISLVIIASILLVEKNYLIGNIKNNKESFLIVFCIIIYYLCQLPGLTLNPMADLTFKKYFLWLYTIILFVYGLLTGIYLKDKTYTISASLLLILLCLLIIDVTVFSFNPPDVVVPPEMMDPLYRLRAIGTLRNPNNAAFVLVVLLVASLQNPIWRLSVQTIFLIILTGFGVVLTASMGGVIAIVTVAGIIIFFSINNRQVLQKYLNLVIPLIIVMSLLSIYIVLNYRLGINIRNLDFDIITSYRNIASRLEGARIAIDLFLDKPLFGYGLSYVQSMKLGPHNMLLRILVEGGILGIFGAIILLSGGMWIAYKRKSHRLLLLIIALLSIGLTSHNLFEDRSIVFISGMLFAFSQIEQRGTT
jgi:O-antigen ligase